MVSKIRQDCAAYVYVGSENNIPSFFDQTIFHYKFLCGYYLRAVLFL